ncbi:MAG: methylglyoxal synthase [Ignavibacteriaceae bacterium]
MGKKIVSMNTKKKIAIIAHDNCKPDIVEWAKYNRDTLSEHELFGTGTTGSIIASELKLNVRLFKSGPLGGDQQVGANIAEGNIDFLIFFWDPLEPLPHDPDIKALLRIAAVYNIPVACNKSSADFMISSPLMKLDYPREILDYKDRHLRIDGNKLVQI